MNYKINQNLYKHTKDLNYGGVWNEDFNFKYYLSPRWMVFLRFILKVFFIYW